MYITCRNIFLTVCFFVYCSDDATKDDGAFVETVAPPQNENKEEEAKVDEGVSAQQLMDELAATAARQTELVAQLKTRYVGESSTLAQKDEEIAVLRAQLAEAQAEVGSFRVYTDKVTNEKLTAMAELEQARGQLHQFRANLTWAVRYLEEKKEEHFANIAEFKVRMEKIVQAQEEKLRGLSIEYDEELYPHLMSTIAERRYFLFSFLYFIIFCCYAFP